MTFAFVKKAANKKSLKVLGKRIKELREQQKISQDQLAFESEVSRKQIIRIELGKHSTSISNILAISNALNIQLKELLDFEY